MRTASLQVGVGAKTISTCWSRRLWRYRCNRKIESRKGNDEPFETYSCSRWIASSISWFYLGSLPSCNDTLSPFPGQQLHGRHEYTKLKITSHSSQSTSCRTAIFASRWTTASCPALPKGTYSVRCDAAGLRCFCPHESSLSSTSALPFLVSVGHRSPSNSGEGHHIRSATETLSTAETEKGPLQLHYGCPCRHDTLNKSTARHQMVCDVRDIWRPLSVVLPN